MLGLNRFHCTYINSTNKTDHHDITEILLKVAFNTINPNPNLHKKVIINLPAQSFRYHLKVIIKLPAQSFRYHL